MSIRDLTRILFSILLFLAGAASLVLTAIVLIDRLHAIETSSLLSYIAALAMLIYSVINIAGGITGLAIRDIRKTQWIRPVCQLGVIICIFQIVVSSINGIMLVHLAILAGCGILIPEIFIIIFKHLFADGRTNTI